MKLSTNQLFFEEEFGLKKTMELFASVGYEALDFNADFEEYHTDAHDRAFYEELRSYADFCGIEPAQSHAPYGSSFKDEEKTKKRFSEIVKAMEHMSWMKIPMIVVHPYKHLNYKEGSNREILMEQNLAFFRRLIPYGEAYGIKIAIENIDKSITETAEGMLELYHALNSPVITLCYDVGHSIISGQDTVAMLTALAPYIGCTHFHDSDGVTTSHTLPFYGEIDWESVMRGFAQVGYRGNLSFEAGKFLRRVPPSLRAQGASYMASVGKYLVSRFEHYKKELDIK